ncbi:hypothetical protein Val02_82350 [Virgisporangium aliadipatigenens]|uniref:Uncharacterized protein n=1 Tax=Virgisporangium aliadipatigenens TaxID=741659 RepID=A0A8J3YT28_9ACTN|nr:hypothetical protein [Virgisporangium aliadipatigenens]GIJ51349.1 hypothetical protein Val02_82350 [Virgisporangium aliadipatigenens]
MWINNPQWVYRRSGDDGSDRWLVQFWHSDDAHPPRWLVRRPHSTPGWTYQTVVWTNSGGYRMPDGARIVSRRGEAIRMQVSIPTDGDGFFGRQ